MNETEFIRSKALWEECFGDGMTFVDWYYRTRTRPEYVLGAFSDGMPIAMLHMIPMKMRFSGRAYDISFVAGVCTKPEYRQRGVCAELFKNAFPIMAERGFDATVIQPFSAAFYERFGYKTFIRRKRTVLEQNDSTTVQTMPYDCTNTAVRPYELLKLYNDFTSRFGGCSIRDENYFKGFIEEFSAPNARLTVTENGCSAGYEEDGAFVAYELFFRDGEDPVGLLPKGYKKYVFPLPEDMDTPNNCSSEIEEFSMLKPLKSSFIPASEKFYGFDKY